MLLVWKSYQEWTFFLFAQHGHKVKDNFLSLAWVNYHKSSRVRKSNISGKSSFLRGAEEPVGKIVFSIWTVCLLHGSQQLRECSSTAMDQRADLCGPVSLSSSLPEQFVPRTPPSRFSIPTTTSGKDQAKKNRLKYVCGFNEK